jgi:acyl-CoA synthetase (AMP-forming)/AMP-acid ligase II
MKKLLKKLLMKKGGFIRVMWVYLKDEFLKIVDRKKDIIITSGGKNVSPSRN